MIVQNGLKKIETPKVHIFEVVLLAAMEYNRVDDNDDQVSVEGTEKKPTDVIHSDTDKKEEREITTDKEKRAIKLDRNVEAAWTNKTKSQEGNKHICCVSWYHIFRFLGETKYLLLVIYLPHIKYSLF